MKFSVVTVCLNSQKFVAQTVESVLAQDYPDFEYIIIDGGSTDGTVDLISRFAENDERITWRTGPDEGIADAMNKGLALAAGEWIIFLHADDRFTSDHILKEVAQALSQNPDKDWGTGGINEIDAQGHLLRTVPVRDYTYQRLKRNNIIFHPATFVRRDVLADAGGFDVSLKYTMDYDLWLRLGQAGTPVSLRAVVADFRVHQGSLSSRERIQTLTEEYSVRKRYVVGPFSGLGHFLYYVLRLVKEKSCNVTGEV